MSEKRTYKKNRKQIGNDRFKLEHIYNQTKCKCNYPN